MVCERGHKHPITLEIRTRNSERKREGRKETSSSPDSFFLRPLLSPSNPTWDRRKMVEWKHGREEVSSEGKEGPEEFERGGKALPWPSGGLRREGVIECQLSLLPFRLVAPNFQLPPVFFSRVSDYG